MILIKYIFHSLYISASVSFLNSWTFLIPAETMKFVPVINCSSPEQSKCNCYKKSVEINEMVTYYLHISIYRNDNQDYLRQKVSNLPIYFRLYMLTKYIPGTVLGNNNKELVLNQHQNLLLDKIVYFDLRDKIKQLLEWNNCIKILYNQQIIFSLNKKISKSFFDTMVIN